MDYKDEQRNEIEALESIYCGELEILATEPFYIFAIPIKTEEYEAESGNEDQENFEEGDDEKLKEHLTEQMNENLGMVMVFTLVSAAQEWLNVQWDKIKLNREESAAKKLKELEEAERKKFEGTRVTVETFLSWKEKFDEEMGYTKRREMAEREGKKLTGRELFMTDKTLDQSDLKFLDDDSVKIDESLFQNLDDLDLEGDDDEDDPDYEPNVSDASA
ncbi:RWD domain-containing protein 1 isoform X2 [Osmia lignaria lignaria]|uniref:RWD domain-containing protein 1 isoform X2 n=1 Tax=Osmia lignaria lignaria TaxID=1437193 RepID=UPI0014796BE6|nr:RWD domain-containing protein 1 isoform X2 [Osmia lignaria]